MDFVNYVNIRQGTKSVPRFSHGNTLPLLQRPNGFAVFAPQTNSDRGAWFYHPEDRSFEGIRLTHQPSPWIGDWGAITLTAQLETPYSTFSQSWSGFDPKEATFTPYYMKCLLKRPEAVLELTPTEYGGWIRASFLGEGNRFLSLIPVEDAYDMWFEAGEDRLHCHSVVAKNHEQMEIFLVLQFEKGALDHRSCYGEDFEGRHLSFCENVPHRAFHLAVEKKSVLVKMAVSYVSDRQAVCNLNREDVYGDFEALKEENKRIWDDTLGKIQIRAEEKVMKTFYSCLYRAFLFPHKAYELDEEGNPIHYAPACREVRPGLRYTDNGFWDTYRTVYPFLSIVDPEKYREILEGFLSDYRDGGWLPRWTSGTAYCCMPGTAIDAVIADAAVKGILKGESLEFAYEGMKKHAREASPLPEYGRAGIRDFEDLGYMPYDKYPESVNLTLDASYFDFCIARVAELLGRQEEKEYFDQQSKNYKNLFDPKTGFMRGKDSGGNFRPDFDPCRWGEDYTEAGAWQTTFAVQHDLDGLAAIMGGREAILKKLDSLFAEPPRYRVGSYRQEIHEMTEMAAMDWGQCALSNQPSFHIPYLYAWFGQPEKTAWWVRRACQEGFSGEDDGFPGDEDNGSMALCYVFAVLGIYPISPGKPLYTHIPPMAESITILGRNLDLSDCGNLVSHEELMARLRG